MQIAGGLKFSFLSYWNAGVVTWVFASLNGSLDLIWSGQGFYFVPHLIPGRPFSPHVVSQVTLMGKSATLSAKTGS